MKKSPLNVFLGVITILGGLAFFAYPFLTTWLGELTGRGCVKGPTGKCDGALELLFITIPVGLVVMAAGVSLLFEKSHRATAASKPKVTSAAKKRAWILIAVGIVAVALSSFAANQFSALDPGDGSLNQLSQLVGGISWVGLILIGYAIFLLRKK